MRQLCVLAVLAFCATSLVAQVQEVSTGLAVTESKLGKNVVDREIAEEAATFAVDERAYLWMRITGGPADAVTVTWSVDDYTWKTDLAVGASTWRTWAYKTLFKAGEWKVTVTNAAGDTLLEKTFTVTP